MKTILLEIACFNSESVLIAAKAGADRVELCDDLQAGGITPSKASFEKVKNAGIEIFVMIRPRGGDFSYSNADFEVMKQDILSFKKMNADGFVFGILKENEIDVERNKQLVELAKPLPCTFHRAFDQVSNSEKSLEDLITCGFIRVLTSGTKKSAEEGIEVLARLHDQAKDRIIILPGGGVRSVNCKSLLSKCKTSEIHTSAITGSTDIADPEEIQHIKQLLS